MTREAEMIQVAPLDKLQLVEVSPAMCRAGIQELIELREARYDDAYLVRAIYRAMEYERRESVQKLPRVAD